ncbi:stress protein, partial [Kitasatospora paranensis]
YSRAASAPDGRAAVRAWRLPPGGAPVPLDAEGQAPSWRRAAPGGFRPAVPAAAFPVPEAAGGPGG